MTFNRRIPLLSIAFAIGLPALAHANAEVCADIQRRLNGGTLTIGNNAETRRITREINDQNAIVRQIRIDMRRNGCSIGSVIVYGNKNAELCGELGDQLVEARAELDFLTSQRNNLQLTQRSDLPLSERRRLEDAWDDYGCMRASLDAEPARPAPEASRPQVIGRDAPPLAPPITIISPTSKAPHTERPSSGSLRTVCVRLCDGKFFPVSSNATPLDFAGQGRQCQQACPASETQLFYHSLIEQETKDMISTVTGKRYASLPTAFQFQSMGKARDNSCSCGERGSIEFGEKAGASASLGPPAQKIEPNSAPQQQNAGNPQPIDEGRPYVPGERKVRSVGPEFFPQDSKMDLTNPAVKGAQPQQ